MEILIGINFKKPEHVQIYFLFKCHVEIFVGKVSASLPLHEILVLINIKLFAFFLTKLYKVSLIPELWLLRRMLNIGLRQILKVRLSNYPFLILNKVNFINMYFIYFSKASYLSYFFFIFMFFLCCFISLSLPSKMIFCFASSIEINFFSIWSFKFRMPVCWFAMNAVCPSILI